MFVGGADEHVMPSCFAPSDGPNVDNPLSLQLRLREKLKPYLPYVDLPKPTSGTRDAEYALSQPDEGWIDLEVIRSWLEACKRRHGHDPSPSSLTCSPAWLIDVDDLCLVRGESDMQYFALSYVWGRSKSTCTEKATLELLQQCGALKDAIPMPKTIAHAVHLTKLLGERYLWVDRFCIVQDGGSDKQAQLDAMGDIYAGAFATIIVARARDANEGLVGIPGVTSRRRFSEMPSTARMSFTGSGPADTTSSSTSVEPTPIARAWNDLENKKHSSILYPIPVMPTEASYPGSYESTVIALEETSISELGNTPNSKEVGWVDGDASGADAKL